MVVNFVRFNLSYSLVASSIAYLVELGLSMLAHALMPLKYWDETFLSCVHIINRFPSPNLSHNSPYQIIFHTPPTYTHLKIFGCVCFPNLRPYNTHKLQFKSVPCTFLGYCTQHKGYKCLSLSGHIFISRDVIFYEQKFSFSTIHSSVSSYVPSFVSSHVQPSIRVVPSLPLLNNNSATITNGTTNTMSMQDPSILQGTSNLLSPVIPSSTASSTSSTTRYMIRHPLSHPQTPSPPQLASKPPVVNDHTMATRGKKGIFKPKALLSVVEPTSVTEALKDSR